MKKVLLALFVSTLSIAQNGQTHHAVGDAAPDFELKGSDGKSYKLSSFAGKNPVILAFFPAAFTGGCTKEMSGYQASLSKFTGMEVKVFGISTDSPPTLAHWSKELNAEFPMLSDMMRNVSMTYGVLNPKTGMADRTTFVVDASGKIAEILEGAKAIDISGSESACKRLVKK